MSNIAFKAPLSTIGFAFIIRFKTSIINIFSSAVYGMIRICLDIPY
jgi:hypothetical protein